ncbi:hypothetical protein DM860_011024 [Cuscuta australis]|uniref:Uncharacterized protein n=1 Tax=Cuscuta australis TaxID=267555 RepID=A0A328E0L6_9ASTE|nr:hypothetical protein DM860_011024 [Cuscuta australis]
MPSFNEQQKQRRAAIAEQKRARYGDPITKKLKQRTQPLSISGKRQRKLFKKWRRDQKEAIGKGLITMEDVEMAVADGKAGGANKNPMSFHLKKSSKLKVKQLKKKNKKKGKSKTESQKETAGTSGDAMEE